jgi:hypothetical protein
MLIDDSVKGKTSVEDPSEDPSEIPANKKAAWGPLSSSGQHFLPPPFLVFFIESPPFYSHMLIDAFIILTLSLIVLAAPSNKSAISSNVAPSSSTNCMVIW